jgi:ATP synthase protein I
LQAFGRIERRAGWQNVDNSLAAARRLAIQVILVQVAVAIVVGLGFLLRGVPAAIGAFAAGFVVALGTCLLALPVFAPALAGPGATVARFAVGTLMKWVVVIAGLYLIIAYWRLPAVPALVGLIAALLVNLGMLGFKR